MNLPITWTKLQTFVKDTQEEREEEFRDFVMDSLISPMDVVTALENEIRASIYKKDGTTCFRVCAARFPSIYKRFGDQEQVQKELSIVLEEYLKNFPTTTLVFETSVMDVHNTPISCHLILCFSLPWTPPTLDQTSNHSQSASVRDGVQYD